MKAVAFVGAGASAGMYPQWGQVIDQLADYAVDQGRAEPRDRDRWKADKTSTPQQRVNTILRRLDEARYHDFLRSTFEARRGSDGEDVVQHGLVVQRCSAAASQHDPATG